MAELSHAQHELFCREYVIDHNGARAALAAGYSTKGAKQQAHKLLARPEVAARVAELDQRKLKKADITAERVMLELGRMAFADLRRMYGPDGQLLPVHELDDDAAAAIAGIEVDTVTVPSRRGKPATTIRTTKVKRFQKDAALRVLAQHFKIVGPDLDETLSAAALIADRMEKARARLKRMRRKD